MIDGSYRVKNDNAARRGKIERTHLGIKRDPDGRGGVAFEQRSLYAGAFGAEDDIISGPVFIVEIKAAAVSRR